MGESSAQGDGWVLITINQDLECSILLTALSTVLYPTLRRRAIVEVFRPS